MTTKWVPLKDVSRRVKEVILRTFGQMIKCQALADVETLLLSLFVVITNETDGLDKSTGQATPCEKYKQRLIRYTSTGIVNVKFIDELLNIEEIDEEERITFEKHENITDIPVNNPFQKWAVDVYERSKHFIREGSGINAMYLPTLVSHIIKSMKLLPLWSGVMVPVFGYGEETASSAAVESSFKKLKTLTFKDISLPTNIEDFLERHILSLRGSSLIRSTFCHKSIDHNEEDTTNDHTENPELNVANESMFEEDYIIIDKNNINDIMLSEDSEKTVLKNIKDAENIAEEGWNRKSKRQRGLNSYLCPNPHLRHLNLSNARNIVSLPILKNGSRANELKTCFISGIGKVMLTNTCAFDAIASIFITSYCDSRRYSEEVSRLEGLNKLLNFISSIVQKGIIASTYKERAEILMRDFELETKEIEYDVTLVSCHTTAATIVKTLFENTPTAFDFTTCSNPLCKINSAMPKPVTYITYHTSNNAINNLQEFINERFNVEHLICRQNNIFETESHICNGEKIITTKESQIHLVIEVLKWEGDNCTNENQTTEAAPQVHVKLKDIPQILHLKQNIFELRGVCAYYRGISKLRTSIGHYMSYCKRGPRNWEIFDDLKSKSKPVKENTEVPCEVIVYTI